MSLLQTQSFMEKHHGPHAHPIKGPNQPKWYIVDAKDQVVGRLATVIARVLTGKHKPTFTKHTDCGDFVIVTNADQIVFTRNKWDNKKYYDYTGYIGGLKEKTARELNERRPEDVLKRAVWGMIEHNPLGRRQMSKLKLYAAGKEHPHKAQKPEPLPDFVKFRTALDENAKKKKA